MYQWISYDMYEAFVKHRPLTCFNRILLCNDVIIVCIMTRVESNFRRKPWRASEMLTSVLNAYHYIVAHNTKSSTIYTVKRCQLLILTGCTICLNLSKIIVAINAWYLVNFGSYIFWSQRNVNEKIIDSFTQCLHKIQTSTP